MTDSVPLNLNRITWATACGAATLLAACGGSDGSVPGTVYKSVPRAQCRATDRPETDLQGRVPLEDRISGRSQQPYSCNLDLVGQHQGEGASWQFAWFEDCGYYGTANTGSQQQKGVVVIDASDPTRPVPSDYLTSIAMLDPWESLNEQRKLLAAPCMPAAAAAARKWTFTISRRTAGIRSCSRARRRNRRAWARTAHRSDTPVPSRPTG
jgi:hypothetical protein